MKIVVLPSFVGYWLKAQFIVLPVIGYFVFRSWGALIGLAIAIVVWSCYPRWRIGLTRSNIESAIRSLYRNGIVGQNCIKLQVKGRMLIVGLNEWQNDRRVPIAIPTRQWPEIVKEFGADPGLGDRVENSTTGWLMGKECLHLYPKNSVNGTIKLIDFLLERAGANVVTDVAGRALIGVRNVWEASNLYGSQRSKRDSQE